MNHDMNSVLLQKFRFAHIPNGRDISANKIDRETPTQKTKNGSSNSDSVIITKAAAATSGKSATLLDLKEAATASLATSEV